MSDFDYTGISESDVAILRGLGEEIERVNQDQGEVWLLTLAPKFFQARAILSAAKGRRFQKAWRQWIDAATGDKHRTGDRLAGAHKLVQRWGLGIAELKGIAGYRSVICDLAAPTMPEEIQDEFLPRLLGGEEVTRKNIKDRRREHDAATEGPPADERAPVDLPEPEPEENVETLKAQIAELKLEVAKRQRRIAELEGKRRSNITVDDARSLVGVLCRDVRTLQNKFRHDDEHVNWEHTLDIDPANHAASNLRLAKIQRGVSRSISRLHEVSAYVRMAQAKIRANEDDEILDQIRHNRRKQVPIIWETERARRVLPWEVKILNASLWRHNYRGERVLTDEVRKYLSDDCPCQWGAYIRYDEDNEDNGVFVRFADQTIAAGFKYRWGWAA